MDLLVGSVRGLHFILYVFCELPLPCLILKHFEALSTPAQPTGHSPAAGSTWQVKAVVFAAHLPSSLHYCLWLLLKLVQLESAIIRTVTVLKAVCSQQPQEVC